MSPSRHRNMQNQKTVLCDWTVTDETVVSLADQQNGQERQERKERFQQMDRKRLPEFEKSPFRKTGEQDAADIISKTQVGVAAMAECHTALDEFAQSKGTRADVQRLLQQMGRVVVDDFRSSLMEWDLYVAHSLYMKSGPQKSARGPVGAAPGGVLFQQATKNIAMEEEKRKAVAKEKTRAALVRRAMAKLIAFKSRENDSPKKKKEIMIP